MDVKQEFFFIFATGAVVCSFFFIRVEAGFEDTWDFPYYSQISLGSVVWGDYDQDGDLDLALSGDGVLGKLLHVYENTGSPDYLSYRDKVTEISYGSIAWGDYDQDGKLDLAVCGIGAEQAAVTRIYHNTGTSFEDIGVELPGTDYSALAWGDCDNDGDLDLVLTGHLSSEPYRIAKIYKNENGNFSLLIDLMPNSGVSDSSVAWGDYDNDGDLDLALCGVLPGTEGYVTKIFKNKLTEDGTFPDSGINLVGMGYGCLAWGDYDNDGDLDLGITGADDSSNYFLIYTNNGDGTFDTASPIEPMGTAGVIDSALAWGDYDNDGDLDIAIAGRYAGEMPPNYARLMRVYSNDSGEFSKAVGTETLTGVAACSLAWGDYDNDGDLDLAVIGSDGESNISRIYKNDAAKTNPNNAPNFPTNLFASYEGGRLTLKWDPATDDKTPASGLYYNLRVGTTPYQNPGDDNLIAGSYGSPLLGNYLRPKISNTKLGHIIEKIAEGRSFWWSAQSIDAGLTASAWAPEEEVYCEAVPPCGISNLTALPGDKDGEISLQWTAPGDDGTLGACEWYLVKYATYQVNTDLFDSASTYFQDWIPKDGMTAEGPKILSGFTPGTTYYFAIRAWDGCVYSHWETDGVNTANRAWAQDRIPIPPQNLTALAGDQIIDLSWDANPEPDIKQYLIYRSSYAPGTETYLTLSPATTHQDTGLINYNTYFYYIKVEDYTNHTSTGPSNTIAVYPWDLTPPAAITDLYAATGSTGTIDLSWTAPGDDEWEGEIANGAFRISYSTLDFGPWTSDNYQIEIPTSCSPFTTHHSPITSLEGDTTYFFCIWTADECLNWSSDPSNIAYAKTVDTVPPAAVLDLTSLAGEKAGDIILSWSAPGDNGYSGQITDGRFQISYSTCYPFPITDYQVEIPTSCSPGDRQSYTFTAESYFAGGLHAGVTYYFHIRTADEVPNWSELSNLTSTFAQYDTIEPVSGVEVPIDGERYRILDKISGTARDDYSGVHYMDIAIRYWEDGTTYSWDGSAFQISPEVWLLAEGTTSWWYCCVDTTTGVTPWTSGKEYLVTSRATDVGFWEHSEKTTPEENHPEENHRFVFDNEPPQAITDLSALTGGQGGEIKLSWTAPRDEPLVGGGSVTTYTICYATFSIADLGGEATVWWNSVGRLVKSVGDDRCVVPFGRTEPSAPTKVGPGSLQEMTIGGLEHGVTYWFGIKSEDDALPPNISDLDDRAISVTPQANAVARYADEATFFKVSVVLNPITAGVRSNFTVEPWNPNQRGTGYRDTVHFSSDDKLATLPDDYTFNSTDAAEGHTFIGGVIFRTAGGKSIYVQDTATPTIRGEQPGITVEAEYTDIVDQNGKEVILPDGVAEDGNMSVVFPQGAVSKATTISIKVDETGGGHKDPENKYIDFAKLNSDSPVAGYLMEDRPPSLTGKKLLTLTLLYTDLDMDGKIDGTNIEEENLRCFWWDGFHWRYLGGRVDTQKNVVTAKTNKLGLFALFPVKTDYASLCLQDTKPKRKIITPNNDGENDEAEFIGLEEPFKIIVYDFTGQVVREIDQYPTRWDGTDGSGRTVESGIYIYKIRKDGKEIVGTIVVAK